MKQELTLEQAKKQMASGVSLLVFKTSWCTDCKMMDLMIEAELPNWAQENITGFKIIHVDAEKENLFRKEDAFKIMKVPSFYLVKDGVAKHLGYEFIPTDLIKEEIKTALQ